MRRVLLGAVVVGGLGGWAFGQVNDPTGVAPVEPTEAVDPADPAPDPVTDWLDRVLDPLAESGLTVELFLALDGGINLRGGVNTGAWRFQHLFDLTLRLETEPLLGWKGGTVAAVFQNQAGRNVNRDVASWQFVNDLEADGITQLSELWFEQRFFDDESLAVRLGKIDAFLTFAMTRYGTQFMNAERINPTNFPAPTYPDPAFGGLVRWQPDQQLYLAFGLFDGALQQGISTGGRGPATLFGDPGDLFYIGEAGFMPTDATRIAAGGWFHDGAFDAFDGSTQQGATGGYLLIDQSLWREHPGDPDDNQGLGASLIYSLGDGDVLAARQMASITLEWTGALPGRDDDLVGLGGTWVDLVEADTEWSVELFYQWQVTPWMSVKPDLQYVVNPADADASDALAAQLRVVFEY
jgi:porin